MAKVWVLVEGNVGTVYRRKEYLPEEELRGMVPVSRKPMVLHLSLYDPDSTYTFNLEFLATPVMEGEGKELVQTGDARLLRTLEELLLAYKNRHA